MVKKLFYTGTRHAVLREKYGENLFFKASANRFWLTSKNCSW